MECSVGRLPAQVRELAHDVKILDEQFGQGQMNTLFKQDDVELVSPMQEQVELIEHMPNPIPRTRQKELKAQATIPHPAPPKSCSPLFDAIDFHMIECDSQGVTNIVRPISCGTEDNRQCRMNNDRKIRRVAFDVDKPIIVRIQQYKCTVHDRTTHYFNHPQVSATLPSYATCH